MNRELRHVETGIGAARLAPDFLTEAIGVEKFVGADTDLIEPVEQPEPRQFLDRMRQRVDADTEFADLICLFVNLAVDPARMQHERSG